MKKYFTDDYLLDHPIWYSMLLLLAPFGVAFILSVVPAMVAR
mgnify:CR=1 FL=1